MRLKGKVAFITGGGRGIGRAIALAMSDEGADVVVLSRTASEVKEVAATIWDRGRGALPLAVDATDGDGVRDAVAKALNQFHKIDILVNGATVTPIGPLVSMRPEQWEQTLKVNLTAAFLAIQAVLPGMIRQKSGCIINVASEAGLRGVPNFAAYCATKFGLVGLTKALAKEMEEHRISVNAICPALLGTRGTAGPSPDMAKAVPPQDVAEVALFLATDQARAVTGTAIEVLWRTV